MSVIVVQYTPLTYSTYKANTCHNPPLYRYTIINICILPLMQSGMSWFSDCLLVLGQDMKTAYSHIHISEYNVHGSLPNVRGCRVLLLQKNTSSQF